VITAIFVLIIFVAGIFAFVPINKASAIDSNVIDVIVAGHADITAQLGGVLIEITGQITDLSGEMNADHAEITGDLFALSNEMDADHADIFGNLTGIHDWITGGHNILTGEHALIFGNQTLILGNLTEIHSSVTGGHFEITGLLLGISNEFNADHADLFGNLTGIHDWITGGHNILTGEHVDIRGNQTAIHSSVTGGHFEITGILNQLTNEHVDIFGNLTGIHDWITGGHNILTGEHANIATQQFLYHNQTGFTLFTSRTDDAVLCGTDPAFIYPYEIHIMATNVGEVDDTTVIVNFTDGDSIPFEVPLGTTVAFTQIAGTGEFDSFLFINPDDDDLDVNPIVMWISVRGGDDVGCIALPP